MSRPCFWREEWMNWKSFALGAAVGAVGGIVLSGTVKDHKTVSPEKVLKEVKERFKEDGKIDGSWISMKPESFKQHTFETQVFKGGISRRVDGELEQFEFIADVKSGTILDVYPL
jgi:predicted small secreted protein